MQSETVFLTGATGFLGSELLRQLLAAGFRARILLRQPLKADAPAGVEVVDGDLSNAGRLAVQMSGCRAVFHSAALVSSWVPDEAEFYRTNLEGFLHTLDACKSSGIETLVYTSTFFALGPAEPPGAVEDSAGPPRSRHPYEHSKSLARQAAREARASGFPIVILYPGVIYGPGPRTQGNIVARLLIDFAAGKMPGLLGGGSQVWSYSHVEDVARGHLLALERARSGGEFVLGGDNVSHRDFFNIAARLTQRPQPRLKIPVAVAMLAGAAELFLARLQHRAPKMTPMTVRMMYDNWACDSSRAQAQLGYTFRRLEPGLRQTLHSLGIPAVEPGSSASG